ncbi:hypothetical protein DDZ16_03660 [Marinilabilia rubra]|uniref:Uncharacterized protein n=1 Tax=Marinilabilia rubra TaxID=2162893 RepID=A0A2U2BCB2_9BACT|nr:hypothetical protein DDZ16_03660 [Marinilabilia rubra]
MAKKAKSNKNLFRDYLSDGIFCFLFFAVEKKEKPARLERKKENPILLPDNSDSLIRIEIFFLMIDMV